MEKLTNLYKPYMLLSIKRKLMLILAVLTCFNMSISAATIEPLWECEAHGVTGSDVVRSSIGFGDKIYVSNVTSGCVEEWNKGSKVREWDVNSFLISQNQNTTIWTAITCDDKGNILVNVGGNNDVVGGTKWVLIPVDGSQMQLIDIKYPSKTTAGRIDCVGRVLGNMLEDAYLVLTPSESKNNIFDLFGPNQSNNVVLINLHKDTKGQVVTDLNKSRIIPSKTACSIGVNVAVNTTYEELNNSFQVKDFGPNVYLRDSKYPNLFLWNGNHLTEQNGIGNDGCSARGFDVFTINDVDYYVVPCNSSNGKTTSFEVRYLKTGDVASQYHTKGEKDSEYSSYTARVCSDGKSAIIYAFNPKDKMGVYTFKPDGYVELIQDLSINTDTTLKVGETAVLKAIITPENATNKTLVWASMDESIVTVDNSGMISAIAPGNTKIIASTTDGTELSDTCVVRVIQLVQDLKIDTDTTLKVGETATITATISPSNATNKSLKWTSLNTDVTIVSNGVITAIAPGTAKIVAETTDGTNLSDTCVVTVVQMKLTKMWTVPADATTDNCSSRTVNGFGDVIYGANYYDGTIEEWKAGTLVASYDVNSFCAINNLGEEVDVYDDYGYATGEKKFQAYTLWTCIMVDDAGNILANVGTGYGARNTCQNWVLLPASSRNAMQLLHIDEFPSPDVTLGRVDVPSRIVGDITGDGAYMYIAPQGSVVMAIMFVGLSDEGKIYCDHYDYSWILLSSAAFDTSTNVATFQTFDDIINAEEEGDVAAKTYIRSRGQGAPFTWNAETRQFERNTIIPNGAGTAGMDVFKIGEVEYIVVPIKSTTGNRGCSVAVYNLADGTEVASWDAVTKVDGYVGSVQARVNADGKTANIYVCGHKDCFGILKFEQEHVSSISEKESLSFSSGSSAVETVEVSDDDAEVEYYNLQGVRVYNPEKGIYIKKQGAKTTKVVL